MHSTCVAGRPAIHLLLHLVLPHRQFESVLPFAPSIGSFCTTLDDVGIITASRRLFPGPISRPGLWVPLRILPSPSL